MRARWLALLAPVRRDAFRRLWVTMSLSFAGDRLQDMAQAWLVATLTGWWVGRWATAWIGGAC